MSAVAPPIGTLAQLPPLPLYRFTVDQYHRLVTAGILSEEDPVELLEGLIVIKGQSTLAPSVQVLEARNGGWTLPLPLPVRRFTVHEYHRLMETGILGEDDPVELLEGWLVLKMGHNPPHDTAIVLALEAVRPQLPAGWHCRVQAAVTTDVSEPEPDLAVVRGALRDYRSQHPRPRNVGVLIEVADTTLRTDRQLKGPLYARVGIGIYWIVNLPERQVEVYTDPSGADPEPGYRQRQDYGENDAVPLMLDGRVVAMIPVRDLLP